MRDGRPLEAGNTVGAYVVLKVFPGFGACASQPDSWHQYSPAVATDQQGTMSYAISPGFWKKGDAVRLARDLTRWTANAKAMVASGAKWQLVTTFNEWGEGTSVEPATEWPSASGYGTYLDALHSATGGGHPAQRSHPGPYQRSDQHPGACPYGHARGDATCTDPTPRADPHGYSAGSTADGHPAARADPAPTQPPPPPRRPPVI